MKKYTYYYMKLKRFISKNHFDVGSKIALILTILTIITMLLTAPEAKGQVGELTTISEIADIATGKDLNWLVLAVAIANTGFSFFLVKNIVGMNKDQNNTNINQIKALNDLTSEIRNRRD